MGRARALKTLVQEPTPPNRRPQDEADEGRQMKKRPKTRSVTTSVEKEKVVRGLKYHSVHRVDIYRS